MGESVFRYRKLNDYTFEELIEIKLVGSTTDLFNDPYECIFCFEYEELYNYINGDKKVYDGLVEHKNMTDIYKYLDDLKDRLNRIIKTAFVVVCFSKTPKKEIMWSHYADDSKGFVLEYDLDFLKHELENMRKHAKENYKTLIDIKDVVYCSIKSKITEMIQRLIFLEAVEEKFDEIEIYPYFLMFNEHMLVSILEKHADWSYEEEVRLFIPNILVDNQNTSGHKNVFSIKPKAIYITSKCPKMNRILLSSIAYKKNIDFYIMSYDVNNHTMKSQKINHNNLLEEIKYNTKDAILDYLQQNITNSD